MRIFYAARTAPIQERRQNGLRAERRKTVFLIAMKWRHSYFIITSFFKHNIVKYLLTIFCQILLLIFLGIIYYF